MGLDGSSHWSRPQCLSGPGSGDRRAPLGSALAQSFQPPWALHVWGLHSSFPPPPALARGPRGQDREWERGQLSAGWQPDTGSRPSPPAPWPRGSRGRSHPRSEKGIAGDEVQAALEGGLRRAVQGPVCLWPGKCDCSSCSEGARRSVLTSAAAGSLAALADVPTDRPEACSTATRIPQTGIWGAEPLLGVGVAPQPEWVGLQERCGLFRAQGRGEGPEAHGT